jgi:zinc transport system ATP-binding protein
MSVLTVKNLCVGYNDNVVSGNISFTVTGGDYVCILGENGVGKSTLVKTLLRLIKPISGEFYFENGLVRNKIGYLPQQKETQRDFPASVYEVVMSGFVGKMGFRPFFSKAEKNIAADNMKKVGIEKIRNKSFNELSGGQQQRVLLARALCASGGLLILDEPTAGLDSDATGNFYELTKKLAQDGTAIVIVSHDNQTAIKYASHILHIKKEHCCFGTADDYIRRHGQWGEK